MHSEITPERSGPLLLVAIFMTVACGARPRTEQARILDGCGVQPGHVVEYDQAICVAKAWGMNEGLCGLTIKNSYPDQLNERLAWAVQSTLEGPVVQGLAGCMCGTSGEVWYVGFEGGQVLDKHTWTGGCFS